MQAPAFWWKPKPVLVARLLQPASLLYAGAARLRTILTRQRSAPIPIICIGNPTVGGAGKTPTAIAVAGMLAGAGRRPVFLTRGYGGTIKGPALVEIGRHGSREVGDEPLILARHAPVIVSADRVAGAKLAASHGDVVVMDDGFQNPALGKHFSILVIDGQVGVGNGLCLPAGPLRMGLGGQLKSADAVLIIGRDARNMASFIPDGVMHLSGRIASVPPAAIAGRPLIAFTGIGRPSKFFSTLEEAGLEIAVRVPFPDHHVFTEREADALLDHAAREKALLVSTEKDCARLSAKGDTALATLAARTIPYPITMEFDQASATALARSLYEAIG
ncbi:MAG: tetraacyldisaccharide 4'-kinase [Rhodobiaceae bacterium]|nr:tetraacyldisaccharide 4'-kinase [Rhodobiaceae bacterium]MCC0054863.1 tetraacyldisaccharide 4'-kinase [Rhodobiaceae bacterium]